jgi:hypothetical protein
MFIKNRIWCTTVTMAEPKDQALDPDCGQYGSSIPAPMPHSLPAAIQLRTTVHAAPEPTANPEVDANDIQLRSTVHAAPEPTANPEVDANLKINHEIHHKEQNGHQNGHQNKQQNPVFRNQKNLILTDAAPEHIRKLIPSSPAFTIFTNPNQVMEQREHFLTLVDGQVNAYQRGLEIQLRHQREALREYGK